MSKVNYLGGRQRQVAFPLVALLVVAADQFAKLWVRNNLSPGQSIPEEGVLRLTYVANKGAVFGVFPFYIVPLIFSMLIIMASFFLYYRYPLFHRSLAVAALGLIVGGSIGNLIDRLCLGYVVDFIDFKIWGEFHWPAFNIADAAIVIGLILLTYFLLNLKKAKT